MRSVWCLKFILLLVIAALGGAAAFATIAPDTARTLLFRQIDWQTLNPEEQQILKPLAGKWAGMKYVERERWRILAEHYKQLSPTEQKRIQKRMQRWAAATPGQRHYARSTYKKFKDKQPAEKEEAIAAWQSYAAAHGMADEAGEKTAPPEAAAKTLAGNQAPTSPTTP